MRLQAPKLVIWVVAASAAAGGTANSVNADELTALLPPVSSDSQAAAEIRNARARNLYDAVISSGEKALAIAPDNIPILLALAEVMPNGTVDSESLDRSEKYATRALELSESRLVIPRLTMDDYDALRRQLRSRAHAALGLVAVKRGAVPLATREFETAVSENPDADGVQLYRLAKLYLASGRRADATALLQKALQIGPQEISSLAAAELSRER